MNTLLILYRYLARSADQNDPDSASSLALRALEPTLDILTFVEQWAQVVEKEGSLDEHEARHLTQHLIHHYQLALCEAVDDVPDAVVALAQTYLPLTDYETVIARLRTDKAETERALAANLLSLGDLDENPFPE